MYLVDTNIWIELLLDQDKAGVVRSFLEQADPKAIYITEFSLYSIGIILLRLKKDDVFSDFLSDIIDDSGVNKVTLTNKELTDIVSLRKKYNLDFDDSYQYVAATKLNLEIVSFDSDFDKTDLKKKTPSDIKIL